MHKYFHIFFATLLCGGLVASGVQDPVKPSAVPGDSLARRIVTVDSSDTTTAQAPANQSRIRSDSSAMRDISKTREVKRDAARIGAAKPATQNLRTGFDSSAVRDSTKTASKSDSLSLSAKAEQTIAADSLGGTPPRDVDTTLAPPRSADTITATTPILLHARSDTAVALPDSASRESSTEALPKALSEEVKSAEENVLRQFTGLFSLPRIVLTLIVIFITYFITRVATVFLTRIGARRARLAPRVRTAMPLLNFGLWFLAAYFIIVGIFARSPLALVLVMAALALAFFLASRRLLQDLVGGLVILFERPFQIGDRIRIGTQYGEVVKIGLRAFRLSASDGAMIVVPNAEIMREAIANANPGRTESLVVAELLLPAGVDVEVAGKIAFEAAAVSPYVYLKKPITVQIDEEYKSELLTKLVVKAYVFDARYENELRSHILTLARKGLQPRA